MDFDIAIATKDRVDALRLSLPLFLRQSRLPRRIIIADASKDHAAVLALVQEVAINPGIEVVTMHVGANLPQQRNIALEHVISPIVMFPDDDALWHPDVAHAVMTIYERDVDGIIGGVCAAPARESPLGRTDKLAGSVKMSKADRLRHRIEGVRHTVDDFIWPDPFWVHGRSLWAVHPEPDWLGDYRAALVEYMGGYRMSFRASVLRDAGGFDSDLGGRLGWAAGEDADASFRVARTHLLVGTSDARVFHHRFPGARGNGFLLGMFIVLNRAYIVSKHSPRNSAARMAVRRFAIGKMLYYLAEAGSSWGRDRIRGVRFALRNIDRIIHCPESELRDVYHTIIDEAIESIADEA